jgi:hypothetical protein
MATAQQPFHSEAAIPGDLALPFAGLGEELVGIVAQGLRLGAGVRVLQLLDLVQGGIEFLFLFCPAGLSGLLCGIMPLLLGETGCPPMPTGSGDSFFVLLEGFGAHGVTVTNKCVLGKDLS